MENNTGTTNMGTLKSDAYTDEELKELLNRKLVEKEKGETITLTDRELGLVLIGAAASFRMKDSATFPFGGPTLQDVAFIQSIALNNRELDVRSLNHAIKTLEEHKEVCKKFIG